jgi:hypothetical protein
MRSILHITFAGMDSNNVVQARRSGEQSVLRDETAVELTPIALPPPAKDMDGENGEKRQHTEGHLVGQQRSELEHGIYWRSRVIMVTTAALGICCCAAHAVFYAMLRGRPANAIDQEIYIRLVQNPLSFILPC